MNATSTRWIAAAALALSLTGCGQQRFPPPTGYVDACYGGDRRDRRQTATTEFVMRVTATEQQWPVLAAKLKKFGTEQGLAVFDTSMRLDWIHMVEVSLCSPRGYSSGPTIGFIPIQCRIRMRITC